MNHEIKISEAQLLADPMINSLYHQLHSASIPRRELYYGNAGNKEKPVIATGTLPLIPIDITFEGEHAKETFTIMCTVIKIEQIQKYKVI